MECTNPAHPGQTIQTRGFTLLELLVVIAIIGMLAAYVGPRYFSQIDRSEITIAKTQIEAFSKALDQYRVDTGEYPRTEQGLNALIVQPGGQVRWAGPYLRKGIPVDPWGRPYFYRQDPKNDDFDLLSYGKDGLPGGSGSDADISNR